MIKILLQITGLIVWLFVIFCIILALPVPLSLAIGWVLYKFDRGYETRIKILDFAEWYLTLIEKKIPDKSRL